MTYQEIVEKAREAFEYADARAIFEHVAVQVNIVGEGSGAFYIEIAGREVSVEPYDYYDRDGLITATAEAILQLAEGKITFAKAVTDGVITYAGSPEKLQLLNKMKLKKKSVKSAKTK